MGRTYLGQNFLKDITYINFIVQKIEKYAEEYNLSTIIEIGPGKCALTRKLVQLNKHMILFEKDTTLCDLIDSVVDDTDTDTIRGDVLESNPVSVLAEK